MLRYFNTALILKKKHIEPSRCAYSKTDPGALRSFTVRLELLFILRDRVQTILCQRYSICTYFSICHESLRGNSIQMFDRTPRKYLNTTSHDMQPETILGAPYKTIKDFRQVLHLQIWMSDLSRTIKGLTRRIIINRILTSFQYYQTFQEKYPYRIKFPQQFFNAQEWAFISANIF